MALERVVARIRRKSRRLPSVAGQVPEEWRPHIAAIEYWEHGASLTLTRAGLDFGRSREGAEQLGRVVMEQPGWQGDRSTADVGREVRAHCRAWVWLPPLRSRANPVDLEFFHSWPGNLLVSFGLRRPGRKRG